MDRVDFTAGNSWLKSEKNKKADKKSGWKKAGLFGTSGISEANGEGSDFSLFFSSAIASESISVENLLDDIHQAGEKLIEKPFYANIKEYRQKIRKFLSYVVKNTYDIGTELQTKKYVKNGVPIVDEKKWTTVKVIDEKLEELATAILQGQRSQLIILRKVEEIEGILVDLLR